MPPRPRGISPARIAALTLAVAVLALRLAWCCRAPLESSDLARQVVYGALVGEMGPRIAAIPLAGMQGGLGSVPFSGHPYNYPPVPLAFFAGIAAISPTLLAARLALTALEAANAVLVGVLTGRRWAGLLYWALPASLWWVSSEGQFEPLQTLFVLLATLALTRGRLFVAGASLAVAVQVKLAPVLLVPWLLWAASRRGARGGLAAVAGGLAGLSILALAHLAWPAAENVWRHSALLTVNHFPWNPFSPQLARWSTPANVLWNQLSTYALAGFLLGATVVHLRHRSLRAPAERMGATLALLALAVYVAALKSLPNVLPWYVLNLPALAVPAAVSLGRSGTLGRRAVDGLLIAAALPALAAAVYVARAEPRATIWADLVAHEPGRPPIDAFTDVRVVWNPDAP
ncbi:DUF2029 domain-containing protein [Myxococcota bacterium]|nr:DUF2029 domain-containing protein [Myxococcota bacterium]